MRMVHQVHIFRTLPIEPCPIGPPAGIIRLKMWVRKASMSSHFQINMKKGRTCCPNCIFSSWWLNQPLWKICSSKWESSPNRGEKNIYLKPPPSFVDFVVTISIGRHNSSWPNGSQMHVHFSKLYQFVLLPCVVPCALWTHMCQIQPAWILEMLSERSEVSVGPFWTVSQLEGVFASHGTCCWNCTPDDDDDDDLSVIVPGSWTFLSSRDSYWFPLIESGL